MILTHLRPFVASFIHRFFRRRALASARASSLAVRPRYSARRWRLAALPLCGLLVLLASSASWCARAAVPAVALPSHPALVWIDTDIGDDIDDAFAIALLLRSPQVRVVGISTAFGDTELRARLLDHFLSAAHVNGIPVYAGLPTATTNLFTQRVYAEQFPQRSHPDAIAALLAAVHQYGNQLTLLAIGPLFNVAAAIQRDPQTMHQLGRIVLMGGSIRHGYASTGGGLTPPAPEWNILQDPPGAKTVFRSGIPIDLYPLDSTQVLLHSQERARIFSAPTPFAIPLQTLYREWLPHSWNHSSNPVLFDVVAAAAILDSGFCPTQSMPLLVTAQGMTLPLPASAANPVATFSDEPKISVTPRIQACLRSNQQEFLALLLQRLATPTHP